MKSRNPKDMGPPITASNGHIMARLLSHCTECPHCGEMTSFTGYRHEAKCAQTNVNGRVMTVRRAAYMAGVQKTIQKGRRITSKCKNQDCINPKLLVQAKPGDVIRMSYDNGLMCRVAAGVRLASYHTPKLTHGMVLQILADERTGKYGAADYGVSPEHFNAIKRGDNRRLANPFRGLMA